MKLVVTGGTGFIGRVLCQALLAEGHELLVLTRTMRSSTTPRLRYQLWDPLGQPDEQQQPLPDGVDGVINLAGESIVARRWTARHKERIVNSRVGTTKALVEAIRRAQRKPAVLISASAIGYYGPHGDETVSEGDSPGRDFLAQVCQQWEAAAQAAEGVGVRVVRLRIGLVLARDGGALAKMLPAFRLGLGGPLGSGRQWMSWIHRDDLIGLMRLALTDQRVSGALNATAPNPGTMREFATALGRVLRRPAIAPVPAWLLRGLLGEMADMLLTGQRVAPAQAMRLGYSFRYPMLSEALRACLV